MELLARTGACLRVIGRGWHWNAHQFGLDTEECKTNRSLYIPMIAAAMHLHLHFATFDPWRIIPNPPETLNRYGISCMVRPKYRVSKAMSVENSPLNKRLSVCYCRVCLTVLHLRTLPISQRRYWETICYGATPRTSG